MPGTIQVRICDGDFYCKPDPSRKSIGTDGKNVKWHCNKGEFEIVFDGENPFNETVDLRIPSEDGRIEKDVKDHDVRKVYAYFVGPQNSAGQQLKGDPGLIIDP